jgi:hypothetical protein
MAQAGASHLLLLARRAASVLQHQNAAALPLLQSAAARCAFAQALSPQDTTTAAVDLTNTPTHFGVCRQPGGQLYWLQQAARSYSSYDINTRTKPHVNVGTIGHVDHGKTTLTAAITKVCTVLLFSCWC